MRCLPVSIKEVMNHPDMSLCAHHYLKRSPVTIRQELEAVRRTINKAEKKAAKLEAELAEAEAAYGKGVE